MALSKNRIKYIHSLELKKNRDAAGVFLAEGPKVVSELLGHFPCQLLAATSGWQPPCTGMQAEESVEVTTEELTRASLLRTPQQVLAIFRKRKDIDNKTEIFRSLCLALDGVQDPGNVGTLIRTAVAAGVTVIAASRDSASLWSPKALRAGMGAHFAAQLYENVDVTDLAGAFDATRLAADARGGSDLYETPNWEAHHTVWMMGAEGPGLSEAALSVADKRLYIPIIKDCESLNVGAAAAVCLFEQRRRRLQAKTLK